MTQPMITAIGTANPPHKINRDRALEFMSNALQIKGLKKEWLRKVYANTGIENRFSVLPDFSRAPGQYRFFPNTEGMEPFPRVEERMEVYREEALPLAKAAIEDCCDPASLNGFTHLITVSCTGMYAPGLDIDLIHALGMKMNIERTAVNFMGCYAAFNALKLANHICRSREDAKVLIVAVELCSIHFMKSMEKDNLIAASLFGDGAAAVVVENQVEGSMGIQLEHFRCSLVPKGNKDMAWKIGDFGFEMALSSYVPDLIRGKIRSLILEAVEPMDIGIKDFSYFATHPGGKKILESLEEELNISREQNSPAWEVLRKYGNMSSPTVLFVLKDILDQLEPRDSGKRILSMAFGPGLTIETGIMKVVAP